jgi:outer membrane protein TolC
MNDSGQMKRYIFLIIIGLICDTFSVHAQNKKPDTIPSLNLDQCVAYGLENQPSVLQTNIGITIAKKTNYIALSTWLPQVNAGADYYHYFQLPTGFTTNAEGATVPIRTGIYNSVNPEITVSENLFSPGLLYAAGSAHLIGVVTNISASFYNLLNTLEQINVLRQDTAEFTKNQRDAYHQYIGGIVDKTDYEEATITLNNAKAQLRQSVENVKPEYASLKQQMGFPPERQFNVNFDTAQMAREITIDTTQQLQYKNRIEYQLLETSIGLQEQTVNYYRFQFLPTLSAFYTYDYEYENNNSSELFSQAYPYSYIGASLTIPLFTGFGRIENTQKAKLQEQVLELSAVNLKAVIYEQYAAALATYKGNIYNMAEQKQNVGMSKDVYNIVSLQYKQGIVPYLNVITAEDNLTSSEINYLNSLFQVLLSKVQLEKAMGTIPVSH